jgi:hypothetical protein
MAGRFPGAGVSGVDGMGSFDGPLSDCNATKGRRSARGTAARNGHDLASGAAPDKSKPRDPEANAKLAPDLQGLAEKVAGHEGSGTVTIGKIRVENSRVHVVVYLTAVSEQVMARLMALGFKELGRRTQFGNFVVGSIHVEELDALAGLSEVERIEPAPRNESR